MSWTYSGDPKASNVDAVRFLVGDTDESDPLVQDEEIEWTLSENANVYAAASEVAFAIAAKFTKEATSIQIGPIREQADTRAKDFQALAATLKNKSASKQSLDVSVSTEETEGFFTTGMHDHHRN